MTPNPDFLRPPPIASWLLNLFAATEDEALLGDLVEEYSVVASRSGARFARRWYWRQIVKTVVHLFGAAFRRAPWSTTAAVIGGFLLHRFVSRLPDRLLAVVTDRYLQFWSAHFKAYLWVLNGMLIEHLIGSMFAGWAVALAAKGREMIATIALSIVLCTLIGAALIWTAIHQPISVGWTLWVFADPFAIVVGGTIVRTYRSAARSAPSAA